MTGKLLLSILVCARMWAADDLVRYVDRLIGTGKGAPDYNLGNSTGDTPPGVVAPFGMVFWSPDTTHLAGGYRYAHTAIQGFSLTHFSGRGISCYQDVPIVPSRWKVYAVILVDAVSMLSTQPDGILNMLPLRRGQPPRSTGAVFTGAVDVRSTASRRALIRLGTGSCCGVATIREATSEARPFCDQQLYSGWKVGPVRVAWHPFYLATEPQPSAASGYPATACNPLNSDVL